MTVSRETPWRTTGVISNPCERFDRHSESMRTARVSGSQRHGRSDVSFCTSASVPAAASMRCAGMTTLSPNAVEQRPKAVTARKFRLRHRVRRSENLSEPRRRPQRDHQDRQSGVTTHPDVDGTRRSFARLRPNGSRPRNPPCPLYATAGRVSPEWVRIAHLAPGTSAAEPR